MWPAPCFCFRHGVDGRDDPVDLLDIVPEPLHLAVEPYFCESSDGESLQFRQLDLEALVDFIVMRIDTKKRLLKLNDHKKIPLTRDMVKKVFNVPSGSKPLEFDKRGKADFREIYLEGERAPIPAIVYVLSNVDDDDEDTINRTWILLCLSLVLAPDTMKEVKKYQDKRNEDKLKIHIGGCLPMLPVNYMDHIDIPRGCIVDHTIDHSLPRACFVKELDFTVVIAVDTMEDGFGKRPLFFTIVKQDHWAVVVVNLMHKQLNVFDSNIKDSDYVSILEKPCSNLDTTSLLNFRKYIAAKLFKHPQNTLTSEEELEKLLKKS
ncbi:hypothetical protein D1007_21601 [Hordeum vulgare]|nr:hypothetical protein D1007_21601 [Hordeum vulgare]